MLTISSLSKRFGDDLVLDRVSLTVQSGERVGLVGPNGCGKSTLLKIICGIDQADSGSVSFAPSDLSFGYLPQGWEVPAELRVGEALLDAQGPLSQVTARLAELEGQMAESGLSAEDLDTLLQEYGQLQERFEALGGYDGEYQITQVREGLGLDGLPDDQLVQQLSGGQKTRLALARLLLLRPALLLLDEPTNHLDVDAVAWLEDFLNEYDGAVLIVSHDRAFLDQTVTRILEMAPVEADRGPKQVRSSVGNYTPAKPQQLRSYVGNYSDFMAAKQHERELHEERYKRQQDYIGKVEGDIARLKGQALGVELSTTPAQPTIRRYAKKVAKKAKSRERKLERFLESDEIVGKPQQGWGMKLDFRQDVEGARVVLRVQDLHFSYPNSGRELLAGISFELLYGERVALVGPNGMGKTTLLKLITNHLEPNSGLCRLGANVQAGYLSQEQELLDPRKTVIESLRAVVPWNETDSRNFLHRYLFAADEVFRPVASCSFGERARLSLALLVAQGCSFLILDEPINHLDIPARERFEQALEDFGGTILAVAHDRYFLEQFASRILALRDGELIDYHGSYADYEEALEEQE
jgi:ATP-binding cassette subfamily F protein 3